MPFATVEVVDNEIIVRVDGAETLAPLVTAATDAATAAASSATAAASSATAAATAEANAETAQAGAEAARDAAITAIGSDNIFLTKAAADAALASVAANAWVRVQADETQGGQTWLYQKVGGAYVSRGAATPSQIVAGESLRSDVQRIMSTNTSRGSRARVVWIMDDGYRSNFLNMAPILERRGQVACIAAEIDRIGSPYTVTDVAPTNRGTIDHPTCTAADYRELIRRGWQILNHMKEPTGGASLATVIAGYKAENRLLQEILTGAKVATGTIGVFNSATPTHPEYDTYPVTGGVYRGGVNNPVWDNATRYVFDSGYRDVPGPQDQPYLYFFDGAKPTALSGVVIDIPNRSLASSLALIEALAGTDATLIIYGHHTPVDGEETSSPPSLNTSAVDAISRKLYECGIQTCTWSQAFPGNLISDPRFDAGDTATFVAASGDTAAFQTSTLYIGETRNARLTATSFRASATQTAVSLPLAVQPWHLYRIRIGYVIGTELTLSGGTGNRNHGLAVTLQGTQYGGGGFSAGTSNDFDMNGAFVLSASSTSTTSVAVGSGAKTFTIGTGLNIYVGQPWTIYRTSDFNIFMKGYVQSYNSGTGAITLYIEDFEGTGTFTDWTFEAYRRPFRATNSKVYFHECIVPSLDAFLGSLTIGLLNATGTVDIVHVSAEDMGSYEKVGLTFPTAFNTTANRSVTLPSLPQSTARRRRWRGELTIPAATPTYTTVNYAEVDSAAIAAPALNETAYVLDLGAGAFANQGGMIATWNGSAWTFAAPANNSYIRCNANSQGLGATVRRWFHWRRSNAAGAINRELFADESFRDGHVTINGVTARIGNWTGSRSDQCILHVFPAWESPTGG